MSAQDRLQSIQDRVWSEVYAQVFSLLAQTQNADLAAQRAANAANLAVEGVRRNPPALR